MTDNNTTFEEAGTKAPISPEDFVAARKVLTERCRAAGITLDEVNLPDERPQLQLGMKCGRDTRWVSIFGDEHIRWLLSIPFEKYGFLADYEAICSYSDGTIEAGLRPAVPPNMPLSFVYRRLFGLQSVPGFNVESAKIAVAATQDGLPNIEISQASDIFIGLSDSPLSRFPPRTRITLKLSGCKVTTYDSALDLLHKISGSICFQLDLLTDVPVILDRENRRHSRRRRSRKNTSLAADLQYPKMQFSEAPLSLYWYARSAAGMPLLQFLAFYQVIEFYFPIYSESEAQRKLKGILKHPMFRIDHDADIAKLLAAIRVSRNGAFGDERSQLHATLLECVDRDRLRHYFEEDNERKEFFMAKTKSPPYHKIPLANLSVDLRGDVADRLYDIRCKIVHTKTDSRDSSIELLLPFSKEADQLFFDIDLVQFLSQQVLIAGSTHI